MKIHFNSFLIMISSDCFGMVLICYFSFSFQVTFKSGNKAVHPCFYKHSLIFPEQRGIFQKCFLGCLEDGGKVAIMWTHGQPLSVSDCPRSCCEIACCMLSVPVGSVTSHHFLKICK